MTGAYRCPLLAEPELGVTGQEFDLGRTPGEKTKHPVDHGVHEALDGGQPKDAAEDLATSAER